MIKVEEEKRFHYLDGLRALAISLVFIHHTTPLAGYFRNLGFDYIANLIDFTEGSGVELFFVLSGVVLLRPYLRGLRKFDYKKYYFRRFQRIYPPYIVAWFLAGAIKALVSYSPTWYSYETLPNFSTLTWLCQIPILNVFGIVFYNGAWWSLGIEIVFYLMVPLFVSIFYSQRILKEHIHLAIILSIPVAIASNIYLQNLQIDIQLLKILLGFFIYLPCFIGGIAIAKFNFHKTFGYSLVAIGTIYMGTSLLYPQLNIHCSYALFYTGLVSLIFTGDFGLLRKTLSHPLLVYIGERSYSLFLIHYSIFHFVRYFFSHFVSRGFIYFLATRIIEIPLAIFFSMLLFYFVERHFSRNLVTARYFFPSKQIYS